MKTVLLSLVVLSSAASFACADAPLVSPAPEKKVEAKKMVIIGGMKPSINSVFKEIEAKLNVKILLSDEVQILTNKVFIAATPDELMAKVCDHFNLHLGKIGTDTYLVVGKPRATIIGRVFANPEDEDKIIFNLDGAESPKKKNLRAWQPFGFNGQTYYVVPGAK